MINGTKLVPTWRGMILVERMAKLSTDSLILYFAKGKNMWESVYDMFEIQ
jgi:hypothetical protein